MIDPGPMNQKNLTKNLTGADRLKRAGITPGNAGNSGGKKGRSGRTPSDFIAACRLIIDKGRLLAAVEKIAKYGEKDSDRMRAIEFLAARGYGQPTLPSHETEGTEVPHDIIIVPAKDAYNQGYSDGMYQKGGNHE